MELCAHPGCAADHDPDVEGRVAPLLVDLERAALERAAIHHAHRVLELAHADPAREGDPARGVLRSRHPRDEPGLAPAELAGGERLLQTGQRCEALARVREILELAGGEAYPLAGVIPEPGEPEALPGAGCDHPRCDAGEREPEPPPRTSPREQSQHAVRLRGRRARHHRAQSHHAGPAREPRDGSDTHLRTPSGPRETGDPAAPTVGE